MHSVTMKTVEVICKSNSMILWAQAYAHVVVRLPLCLYENMLLHVYVSSFQLLNQAIFITHGTHVMQQETTQTKHCEFPLFRNNRICGHIWGMEDRILKAMNMKPKAKCQRIRVRPRWG